HSEPSLLHPEPLLRRLEHRRHNYYNIRDSFGSNFIHAITLVSRNIFLARSGTMSSGTLTPSIPSIRGWDTEQLIQHLQAKFTKFSHSAFNILREQQINGSEFLVLTKEDMVVDGMKHGPAIAFSEYIKELQAEGKRPRKFLSAE
ncbi:hypothetical protein BC936DRAFT_138500, partial [Jimgerdemannia flammicorona]